MKKHIEYQFSALSEEVASSYEVIAEKGGTVLGSSMAEMPGSISSLASFPPDPSSDGNYLLNENVSGGAASRSWEPRADVAVTGSYSDLRDQPRIPSKTSDLENDSGYQTAEQVSSAISSSVPVYESRIFGFSDVDPESRSISWNLSSSPRSVSCVHLFRNGLLLYPGEDYSRSGSGSQIVLTLGSGDDVQPGDRYLTEIWYLK